MSASSFFEQPNIVFILADNLGWGELGCYGGGELRGAPTPRIDFELVARSVEFVRRQTRDQRPFFPYVPLTQLHYPTKQG